MDYEGFIFEVLKHISYKLNFTMTVVEPANTGPRDPATWGAMVDMVAANQVMLGAASFAVTSARREKVDFTEAVDLHPYGFMLVLCSAPSVPQPVVQSRRRPLLGPSPG